MPGKRFISLHNKSMPVTAKIGKVSATKGLPIIIFLLKSMNDQLIFDTINSANRQIIKMTISFFETAP